MLRLVVAAGGAAGATHLYHSSKNRQQQQAMESLEAEVVHRLRRVDRVCGQNTLLETICSKSKTGGTRSNNVTFALAGGDVTGKCSNCRCTEGASGKEHTGRPGHGGDTQKEEALCGDSVGCAGRRGRHRVGHARAGDKRWGQGGWGLSSITSTRSIIALEYGASSTVRIVQS